MMSAHSASRLPTLLLIACTTLVACDDKSKTTDTAESSSDAKEKKKKQKKSAASASAKTPAKPKRHDLSPMPVTIELPADATIKEKLEKGAMINTDGAGLSVSTGAFADKKRTVQNFPFEKFNKWVKDEPKYAIAEMGSKPTYRALKVFEVDGKAYVCSNIGPTGVPSLELAEKIVGYCESLQPKK